MKISIIIPFDNPKKDIEKTIRFIDAQNIVAGQYELIIVCSLEDEKAKSRLMEIEEKAPDIVAIVNVPEDISRAQLLNTGMEYSSGDYIMFVRAGDAINVHLLQNACKLIDDVQPELISYEMTFAHDKFDMFEDDPISYEDFRHLTFSDVSEKKAFLMGGNVNDSFLCHIYSKALIEDVGVKLEDEAKDEDMVFAYPLFLLAESISFTKDHGYCAYMDDDKENLINRITGRMAAQTRLFELLLGTGELYDTYKDVIDAHFVKEYFIKNLKLARGSCLELELPLPTFEVMQYVTLNLVPKWIENDYLFGLDRDDRKLMLFVNEKFESAKTLNDRLKENAFISVITATYNRCDRIKESIECILMQSYQYFEYIIVDDGSEDETERVVKSFDDPRIKFYKNAENRGICYSRNVGIRNACGKYIVCQDDDDYCRLDKLEKTINTFMKLPDDYGMVICESINHTRRLAGNTEAPAIIIPAREMSDVRKSGYIFPALLSRNFITSTAALMRKDYMEEVGLYDEELFAYEDWDIYLRISRKYEVAFVREPLYDYYQRSGTLISNRDSEHRSKVLKSLYEIDQKFVEDRKKYSIETSFKVVEG